MEVFDRELMMKLIIKKNLDAKLRLGRYFLRFA
jgi:hypothetical protein